MLTKGKMLLSAIVALRLLLFVSPVFPHFGVQSIHSQINPQRVHELSAREMRTSKDAAGPHMTQRGPKLSLTSLDVRESHQAAYSADRAVRHMDSAFTVSNRGLGYVSPCLLQLLPSSCQALKA